VAFDVEGLGQLFHLIDIGFVACAYDDELVLASLFIEDGRGLQ